jgi:FlaA1/EpsC-like NDP-sugar epimerase
VIPTLETLDWQGFLGRPPLPSPSPEALDALSRQPILITGAGGSIGSALSLRLAALNPPALVLLEASENNLYTLQRDLAETRGAWRLGAGRIVPVLGSVSDRALLEEIFAAHAPRIVFHAAAHKHVPLMEEHPLAAMANNVFGTHTLVSAAADYGARVVLLATDKAVEPASAMGASKRVAERIVLAAGGTVLRLGNVLASRGSVAEAFARQIARGGPVTVTDPEARRYFLTVGEAVDLLLTAAAHPAHPALLAPILPATHKISDLAGFMAHALAPDCVIPIEFSTLRPGDKETEAFWTAGDRVHPVKGGAMVSIETAPLDYSQLDRCIAALRAALDARDLAAALDSLCAVVPDYTLSRAVIARAQKASAGVPA